METTKESGTILGHKVAERLNQLGISRREFCRTNRISRQTLQDIINNGKTNLLASTLQALDIGLHWETGTALRYSLGDPNARDELSPLTESERVTKYLGRILQILSGMSPDALEREVIWLEEETLGQSASDIGEHRELVVKAMEQIAPGFRERLSVVLGSQTGVSNTQASREGK